MYNKITSKQNDKIRDVSKLLKSGKYRKETNLFVIEGIRLCEEALKNNIKIRQSFFVPNLSLKYSEQFENILDHSTEVYELNESLLEYISDTTTSQGIVAVCEKKESSATVVDGKILILEDIQDPGNMGTILRTSKAFNISTVLLSKGCCDCFSPKVLRASMGGIFNVNIKCDVNLENVILDLKANDYKIYASVVDKKATSIRNMHFEKKSVVLIGNEGSGLKSTTIAMCDVPFTIPMNYKSESLNAAVATSIIIWEMSK